MIYHIQANSCVLAGGNEQVLTLYVFQRDLVSQPQLMHNDAASFFTQKAGTSPAILPLTQETFAF